MFGFGNACDDPICPCLDPCWVQCTRILLPCLFLLPTNQSSKSIYLFMNYWCCIIFSLFLSSLLRWPRSSIYWRPSRVLSRGRVALLRTQWASTVGVNAVSTSLSSSSLSPWLSTLHSPSGSWKSWTSQWWVTHFILQIFVFILTFPFLERKASQLAVACRHFWHTFPHGIWNIHMHGSVITICCMFYCFVLF